MFHMEYEMGWTGILPKLQYFFKSSDSQFDIIKGSGPIWSTVSL